jgi:DNA-binding MarR family transcriptional regulator
MIEALGSFRFAPRLIARRKPMYVATPASCHRGRLECIGYLCKLGGVPDARTDSARDAAIDVALAGDLVTQAARLVRAMRRRFELPAGVRVLSVLDEQGPLTVTQLAAAYSCSQPTMTGLVNQLLDQGWVAKAPHPTDTRAALVTATRTGTAELSRVRRLNGEAVAAQLEHHPTLTAEELRTAVTVLRALTDPPRKDTP